ncbi:hypothetical protein N8K70_13375 [Microbacterium betulae]|uniref:Uncharacterized protein n=1 Tax=Microbacterium betulae TaxID=2981139 RepID=A0AA97FHF9_9MICO|nr:hypothetical protein [Microbacterium sp. AB]WOF22370.1 hypothetical protein N8K70_13375 [Microbacterium sp. AB]
MQKSRFVWAPVIPFAFVTTLGYACLIAAWLLDDWRLGIAVAWGAITLVCFVSSYIWQRVAHRAQQDPVPPQLIR